MSGRFFDLLMYTVLAAIIVLVVMNAPNVAKLISSFGGFWLGETQVLSGTGYQMPNTKAA